MSTEGEMGESIRHLIEKYAEENDIPEELLRDIYQIEQEKITMERREGLPSALRSTMEEYMDHDA